MPWRISNTSTSLWYAVYKAESVICMNMVNSKEELFELFFTFAKTKNWQDKKNYSSIHIAILFTRIYLFVDGFGWRVQISVYSAFMPVAFHLLLRQPFGQNWNQSKTRENTWSTRSDLTLIALDFKVVFYGFLAYYSNLTFMNWCKHFFYIYVN